MNMTISLAGSEERAEFSGANAWLRNDGADVIYAAAKPGITAGADGVVAIPAGQSAPVYGANGAVWLLGTGSVQLIGSDYSTNPFKTSAQAGGSGADNVARAAISAHSGNAEIHVTADEKAAWNAVNYSNPNALINTDFAVNQRGVSGTITAAGYFVDCWKLVSGEVTVNSDGTITLDGTISQTLENAVGDNATASASAGTASYNNSTKTFTLTATGENIAWAKLELGSIATPFVPPDPATELAKCQRYYQKLNNQNAIFGSGFIGSSTTAYIVAPISPMRIRPTLTFVGTAYIWAANHIGSTSYSSESAVLDPYVKNGNSVFIEFSINADMNSVGQGCAVQFRSADSYIELSAEL